MPDGVPSVTRPKPGWRSLLGRAAAVYDEPGGGLPAAARRAAWGGFGAGADWMRLALGRLRGTPPRPPDPAVSFFRLGVLKYAAASALAAGLAAAAWWAGWPVLAAAAVPAFYAVEVQGVFLFPVALDGSDRPVRAARRLTVRAGGTARAMAVVMPIAASMLGGGFVGRGFVRSWCLGCLAVCVWYEDVRAASATAPGPAA